ncbi:phosphoenolpyruvate carboxykinase [Enterocloster lavalensis]|uniref:phosphoenolpyruvate carboxykinase n=1 Tax=Enterocloster lavalensis TaxID=460384 RepID=UPI000D1AE37C|nr:phosphoenolpyruvate carboxykinase [Enterocloster lavalensis]PST27682.1 phosphoenolpyruvate carboxykinase [Enterocloster lavalensis]DAW89011.1 MAG TPA: Recombination enhancement, RecA-dependent nuclease [Bacteriophage sp.]
MAKRLWSVFTDDMDHCYFTGSPYVERHHIFEGRQGYKVKSERRGFVIPLRYDIHPNGAHFVRTPENLQIDDKLKCMAQKYYEEHYGSRQEFIAEFGKNNL